MRGVFVVAVALFAAPVLAQDATPPADRKPTVDLARMEDTWRKQVQARIQQYESRLVDIYKLTEPQKAEFAKLIQKQSDAQIQYYRDTYEAMTEAQRHNIELAQQIAEARKTGIKPEELANLQRLQKEVLDRLVALQAGAPLTADKLAAELEKALPPEQAAEGHREFQRLRPYNLREPGRPTPDPNKPPGVLPEPPPLTPQAARPSVFRPINTPAPTLDRWLAQVENVITSRQYSPAQATKARAIYANVQARAEQAARMSHEASKSTAEAEGAKADAGADPHAHFDRLFDELLLRVGQLATVDQSSPRVAPTPPAPPIERWDAHVERLIARGRLDADTASQARAQLATAKSRASEHLTTHSAELENAGKIEDAARRSGDIDRLWQPVDAIFRDLVLKIEAMSPPIMAPSAPPGGKARATSGPAQPMQQLQRLPKGADHDHSDDSGAVP